MLYVIFKQQDLNPSWLRNCALYRLQATQPECILAKKLCSALSPSN
jgi:hypothetical protein